MSDESTEATEATEQRVRERVVPPTVSPPPKPGRTAATVPGPMQGPPPMPLYGQMPVAGMPTPYPMYVVGPGNGMPYWPQQQLQPPVTTATPVRPVTRTSLARAELQHGQEVANIFKEELGQDMDAASVAEVIRVSDELRRADARCLTVGCMTEQFFRWFVVAAGLPLILSVFGAVFSYGQ